MEVNTLFISAPFLSGWNRRNVLKWLFKTHVHLWLKEARIPPVLQHLYLKVTSQPIFLAGKLPEEIIIAVVGCYSPDLASNGYIYHLKMLPACHLKFFNVLGEHGAIRAPALPPCVPLPMLPCCTRKGKKAEGCPFKSKNNFSMQQGDGMWNCSIPELLHTRHYNSKKNIWLIDSFVPCHAFLQDVGS